MKNTWIEFYEIINTIYSLNKKHTSLDNYYLKFEKSYLNKNIIYCDICKKSNGIPTTMISIKFEPDCILIDTVIDDSYRWSLEIEKIIDIESIDDVELTLLYGRVPDYNELFNIYSEIKDIKSL